VRVSYITPTKHPRPQNGESRRPTISRGTIGDLPTFERGHESLGWWCTRRLNMHMEAWHSTTVTASAVFWPAGYRKGGWPRLLRIPREAWQVPHEVPSTPSTAAGNCRATEALRTQPRAKGGRGAIRALGEVKSVGYQSRFVSI
jgi:hypothetical protein